MKKQEKEAHFAAHIPGVLQYHRLMLNDSVRNRLLYEAITSNVRGETNFLDVGAGTGVWAILAAKLGAKRVVAVEIEEGLIPIIYRHAQENGVADRIEIIHGNSDDVKIRGKFDLIVSELFGNNALGKETVNSFISLRNRFLAPGGMLIPQKLAMLAVPVRIENSLQNLPAELPVKCDFLKSLGLNYSQNFSLSDRQQVKFLGEPKTLIEIDFTTIESARSLNKLSASWKLKNIAEANAFAMFNYSTFTEKIKMDNFASQSWGTIIYEFEPFPETGGELKFDITMDEIKSIWSVSLPSHTETKPKSYSPVFAVTRLKMAHQMTPHRKFKAPQKKEQKPGRKAKGKS